MNLKLLSFVRTGSLWLVLAALVLSGCGENDKKGTAVSKTAISATDATCLVAENWCAEHGVPEDICGQCNAKVAADYQKNGDWCKKHSRPMSQCFLCNPKLADKFLADYETKYGKRPPKVEGIAN